MKTNENSSTETFTVAQFPFSTHSVIFFNDYSFLGIHENCNNALNLFNISNRDQEDRPLPDNTAGKLISIDSNNNLVISSNPGNLSGLFKATFSLNTLYITIDKNSLIIGTGDVRGKTRAAIRQYALNKANCQVLLKKMIVHGTSQLEVYSTCNSDCSGTHTECVCETEIPADNYQVHN